MTRRTHILKELFLFVRVQRAWWIAPIVVILLAVLVLVILGSTSLSPFIYTLF